MEPLHANPYRSLLERVKQIPSLPAVTFYDGNERIELSYKSLDNWVSKTANFLVEEIEVESDDSIYLDLPAHWLKVVWLLAIWATGCEVALNREDAAYTVSNSPLEGDAIFCSLQVMGKLPEAPKGFIDFITEVRRCGDFYAPMNKLTELEYAERWQVPEGSRVLAFGSNLLPEQIAAAMESKSSIVILVSADQMQKQAISRAEKITYNWD
ncbi:MAG TPA: TIGR03089 family protein [Candidatus Nanopelagicaceae bacterium]|nr:TIGR03089 family protein [Candidatus Nanopelagicaceae bacterium]